MNNRFLFSLLFGSLFIILGNSLPVFYKTYLDNTVYYYQNNWLEKNTFAPCEKITVFSDSVSKVTTDATLIKELWKGDSTDNGKVIVDDALQIAIQEGEFHREIPYTLPCDIEEGTYIHRRIFKYSVEGVDKEFIWTSEPFSVQ